jgi:branched-chain amino acid transport system permease protein
VAFRLKTSSFGRAFLSIREDEVASEAMGVNTTKFKVRAFVLAAFFAGIAGGLYGHTLGVSLSPVDAGFQKSFDIIIMVVLGGLGSISGACLAAVIVTLLPEFLRGIADYRMIVWALTLILLMIFRPQGLLGVREIWDARPVAQPASGRRSPQGGRRVSTILKVNNVSKTFGGLKAVSDFNARAQGRRASGTHRPQRRRQDTCFNLLTGVYTPDAGDVILGGTRVNGLRPHKITAGGMARTFQNIRLFGALSVLDNVKLACHLRVRHTMFASVLRSRLHRGEERAIHRARHQPAGDLRARLPHG